MWIRYAPPIDWHGMAMSDFVMVDWRMPRNSIPKECREIEPTRTISTKLIQYKLNSAEDDDDHGVGSDDDVECIQQTFLCGHCMVKPHKDHTYWEWKYIQLYSKAIREVTTKQRNWNTTVVMYTYINLTIYVYTWLRKNIPHYTEFTDQFI